MGEGVVSIPGVRSASCRDDGWGFHYTGASGFVVAAHRLPWPEEQSALQLWIPLDGFLPVLAHPRGIDEEISGF